MASKESAVRTYEDMLHVIDAEAVRTKCRELEEFNDYERRILEAFLRESNRNNAAGLPMCSLKRFFADAPR